MCHAFDFSFLPLPHVKIVHVHKLVTFHACMMTADNHFFFSDETKIKTKWFSTELHFSFTGSDYSLHTTWISQKNTSKIGYHNNEELYFLSDVTTTTTNKTKRTLKRSMIYNILQRNSIKLCGKTFINGI